MSAALTEIKFHGTKLIAIEGDTPETTLIAMKPIVEGMGLDWGAQQKKIRSHPVLAKGVSVTEIPSAGGPQQTLMLPLSRVGFWLALVQTERIKDAALREKVIAYQEECADVLFYRFFGGKLAGGAEGFAGDIDRTVLGGIVKAVMHKELRTELPAMVAAELMKDTRRAVEKVTSVRKMLDDAGAHPKGRRGLGSKIRTRLFKFASHEGGGVFRCPVTNVWLFPVDVAQRFMREIGNVIVSEHNDRIRGQGVFKLVPMPKKEDGKS